jgi:Raf kinase inhibitor-like YbhB/YbcL family protein
MICEDPDAPTPEPWVHWVIYKIPAKAHGLPEHVPRNMTLEGPIHAVQGENSWSKIGYEGPFPPKGHGWHRYVFTLYALDSILDFHLNVEI